MKPFDVIVIGAGIVGCAIARECMYANLHTAIVDAGALAGSATAAGMGHVVVMDDSAAQLALTAYSRTQWQALLPVLPRSVEYESRGTVWIAADAEEMHEAEAKYRVLSNAGVQSHVLTASQLASSEPNLRPGLAGALLVPGDGVIYPPAAAACFLADARRLGAQLFPVRAVSAANAAVHLADGQTISAPAIVLAVGVECDLLPALPIERRKGHLVITDRYPGFVHHQLVELGYLKSAHKTTSDSVAFNIQPRRTGQMLIGSSRQFGTSDPRSEEPVLQRMLDRACSYMPALNRVSALRVWTGFRASTHDKLPLIGPALGLCSDPSLWLAAGFEGLGITNAPGAACLLVDQLLGRTSAIDPTPYLPARLALTQPGLTHA